jgi:hypothetical protein
MEFKQWLREKQVRKQINVNFEMKKQQAQAAAKGAEQQLDIIAEEGGGRWRRSIWKLSTEHRKTRP